MPMTSGEKKPAVAIVVSLLAAALFVLIAAAIYLLSAEGGRHSVSKEAENTPVAAEWLKPVSEGPAALRGEPLLPAKKPAEYTYNEFSFDSVEKGIGLTAQEHVEEKMNSLLQAGDYQKADALYVRYKKNYPDTAMAHRYLHLKARIQALSAE